MNVYDVEIQYQGVGPSCVVAKSISGAEKLMIEKYPDANIASIKLYCEDVMVEKIDE